MTNVGKSRLVKVIFSSIHKISDACANSYSRYIIIAQYMRKVFTFYYLQISLEKWCFWENEGSPQHPQALQQLFSPHLINFIQKL